MSYIESLTYTPEQAQAISVQRSQLSGLKESSDAILDNQNKWKKAIRIPVRGMENWHYTSLKFLKDVRFMPSDFVNPTILIQNPLVQELANDLRYDNLIFINGIWISSLTGQKIAGLNVSLKQIVLSDSDLNTYPLAAANLSMGSGYQVDFDPSFKGLKPVRFVFITAAGAGPLVSAHPQLSVNIASKVKAQVLELHTSIEDKSHYTNQFLEVTAEASSEIEWVRVQKDHSLGWQTSQQFFRLQSQAKLTHLAVSLGCQLSRWEGRFQVCGEQTQLESLGIGVSRREQHLDHTCEVDHQVGNCTTQQHFKNIVGDNAQSVFSGKIKIARHAQKVDSSQLNNNLLLSKTATANSQPILQILADDVKAGHGSTVGQINPEELFYLLSRGIPKKMALKLLAHGFAAESVYRLSSPVLQNDVLKYLDQELSNLEVALT